MSGNGEPKSWIGNIKTWIETIQGIATIAAILAGAYWFFLQRSTKPQVKLDQTVTQRPVDGHSDQTLITVDVRAMNIGKTKVDLDSGQLDLIQINPTPEPPVKPLISYNLKAISLEPGESDQAIFVAVKIQNLKTIQVHSDYPVPGENKKYWNLLSVVDIGGDANKKESATSVQ